MKPTTAIAGALLAVASATAFGQEMSRDQLMQHPQPMQPGKNDSVPTPRTDDSARGGTPSGTSNSGTLMQRREQGMSPGTSQGQSQNGSSTGTMKQ